MIDIISGQIITTSLFSLTEMMVSRGNYRKIALFQISEVL